MGLDEEVSDGDHFVAMSYVKAYPETEKLREVRGNFLTLRPQTRRFQSRWKQ